jgi:hypothetical protein
MIVERRRGYPFHPVKIAGALLLGLGVLGGWVMSRGPALVAPVLNPLSSGLLAGATTFSGTGAPNSRVKVLVSNVPTLTTGELPTNEFDGIAPVDADGNWRLTAGLLPGKKTVVAKALDGDKPTLESNALNLTVGAGSAAPMAVLDDLTINEPRVDVNAFLPNAPFLLTGTGAAGETLDVYDGTDKIGTAVVGADGAWSFRVDPKGVGDRDYSVRKPGANGGPVVTLNIAGKDATGPSCPCKLRFILINPSAQAAAVALSGSGTVPPSQTQTVSFNGKTVQEVFYPSLDAGDFKYSVTQAGFRTVPGSVSLPKNRAISVYLDPAAK